MENTTWPKPAEDMLISSVFHGFWPFPQEVQSQSASQVGVMATQNRICESKKLEKILTQPWLNMATEAVKVVLQETVDPFDLKSELKMWPDIQSHDNFSLVMKIAQNCRAHLLPWCSKSCSFCRHW